jgi:hypothetical protein
MTKAYISRNGTKFVKDPNGGILTSSEEYPPQMQILYIASTDIKIDNNLNLTGKIDLVTKKIL